MNKPSTRSLLVSVCLLAFLRVAAPGIANAEEHGQGTGERGKPLSPGAKIISRFKWAPLQWKVPVVGRDVRREVLPNGIVVYLKSDRSLPVVNVDVRVRTGSIYETRDRHGVAALTGMVMRSGGTKALTPDELDRKLETMAANISTSIGTEDGTATLDVMSKDLEEGLKLLADVIMHPRFDPEKVELARDQVHEGLRRRNDDPGNVSRREFGKVLYGNHPYGWDFDWNVVKGIGREDLVAWHQKYFHPDPSFPMPGRPELKGTNIMIAASGDFDSDAMLAKLRALFGTWAASSVNPPAVASVSEPAHPGVYLVKKELTQSRIVLGHLSTNRDNPDRIPIAIMNYVLGGGSFNSRAVEKIRNDEGLAYSVSTGFSIGSRDRGQFTASLNTRSNATKKAIQLLLDEIKRMKTGQVTPQELSDARDAYANSFVFGFSNAHGTVSRLMQLEFDHLPRDYFLKYLDRVHAVTAEDVARVAREYLRPEQTTILVVGNPERFDGALDALGPLQIVPLQTVE